MTRDQYVTKLSVRLYIIYKRAMDKKIPYSVYLDLWHLFTHESRRATDFNLTRTEG